MNQKILTVSIAAYNVEDFIRDTLESLILEEPYRSKLDIIVVNDGSKDGTVAIAKEYADTYPECIRVIDKENGGYGSTINASLSVAEGRYYKLLDGDDWYDKSGLKSLLDYLDNTDADLIINPYYAVTDKKEFVAHHPEIPAKCVPITTLQLNGLAWFKMHGLTVKTDAIRNYNHPITEKCFYTDFEFTFYCVMASQTISGFDQAVYCYRLGQENQSVGLLGIRKHYSDYKLVAERVFQCYCDSIHEIHGTKQIILEESVSFYTYCIFNAHMLLENPVLHREELIAFDTMIKEKYPEAWKAGMKSRIVSCTRKLHFHFYGLICSYMLWKLKSGK